MISAAPPPGLTRSMLQQRSQNFARVGQSIERLSTGKRINRPSDDPAGFVAAEQLRGELTDLDARLRSIDHKSRSLAEKAATAVELQRGLNTLRGQIVEASGDQLSRREKQALQESVDEALVTLDRVAAEIASGAPQELRSDGAANLIDGDVELADAVVESASSSALREAAALGAEQRGLDAEKRLAQDQKVIVAETLSQIEDTDFAEEASNLSIAQTLADASTAALAYSRQTHADQIGTLLDRLDLPDDANTRP